MYTMFTVRKIGIKLQLGRKTCAYFRLFWLRTRKCVIDSSEYGNQTTGSIKAGNSLTCWELIFLKMESSPCSFSVCIAFPKCTHPLKNFRKIFHLPSEFFISMMLFVKV